MIYLSIYVCACIFHSHLSQPTNNLLSFPPQRWHPISFLILPLFLFLSSFLFSSFPPSVSLCVLLNMQFYVLSHSCNVFTHQYSFEMFKTGTNESHWIMIISLLCFCTLVFSVSLQDATDHHTCSKGLSKTWCHVPHHQTCLCLPPSANQIKTRRER